ncbi:MAG: RdgB/HAM1 family non-canonical purine NTP pyrophosphatase [Nitrospirae bacterium]|nr:MAG: RdgB/HAM1 family non-canonical purine NTP pyrophosphatase [Nitrospirota bacterium]
MDLVLATTNPDKQKELLALLEDVGYRIYTRDAFPDAPVIEEDRASCEANARKKALALAQHTGCLALADDTGLEVEVLGGRPGALAARYAGENATYEANWRKLLDDLRGVPRSQRIARFRTVVAVADPTVPAGPIVETVEGVLDGWIAETPSGRHGFGYDPIFVVPELGKTLAELTLEEKNRVSHRARALSKAKALLQAKMDTCRISGRSAAR